MFFEFTNIYLFIYINYIKNVFIYLSIYLFSFFCGLTVYDLSYGLLCLVLMHLGLFTFLAALAGTPDADSITPFETP